MLSNAIEGERKLPVTILCTVLEKYVKIMNENLTGKRVTYEKKELLDTFSDDSFRSGDRRVYRNLCSLGMDKLWRGIWTDFTGHVKPRYHNDYFRVIDQYNDCQPDRRCDCDRHIQVFIG